MRRIVALSVLLVGSGGLLAPTVAAEPDTRPFAMPEVETARIVRPRATLHAVKLGKRGARTGWVVRLPDADARTHAPTPAVGDGQVYAGGGLGSRRLHAFDAVDGEHLWTRTLNDNGPSTVAVTPGRVVVNTESCTTYGLEPRTGRVAWSRVVGPSVLGAPSVVAGQVVTAHRGEKGGCRLTALDLEDGEVAWERVVPADAIGAPVYRGGRLFLTTQDGTLGCFSLCGTPLWSRWIHASSAPWATAGALYVADEHGAVSRIDPATGDPLWRNEGRGEPGLAPDTVTVPADLRSPADTRGTWAADPPRPVVVGHACVYARDDALLVDDTRTGEAARRLILPPGQHFRAPPAVLGGRLLYATQEGLLLEVDPASGTVERAVDLGIPVDAQPAVAQGRVYVASGDLLVALRWGPEDGPAWPQWGGNAARSP